MNEDLENILGGLGIDATYNALIGRHPSAILGAAAIGGGSQGLGAALMGGKEKDEFLPYTQRGALGGALAGGTIGGLGGPALAKFVLQRAGTRMTRGSILKNALKGLGVGAGLGAFVGGGSGTASDLYDIFT